MEPMRLITPAQASMASLSIVLPAEAWPTMAKLRMSAGLYSFIKRKAKSESNKAARGGWLAQVLDAARAHGTQFSKRLFNRKIYVSFLPLKRHIPCSFHREMRRHSDTLPDELRPVTGLGNLVSVHRKHWFDKALHLLLYGGYCLL